MNGESNELKVTFEFTKLSSSGENSSQEPAPVIINSVEANSIDSAINLMNTYLSKRISLSHCKMIIISESLASKGISEILYSLINKIEIRPDSNLVISKCLAKDFINNTKPNLETLLSKYYEILPNSSQYTGYTDNVKLYDFFNDFSSKICQPTAMLGAISDSDNVTNEQDSGFTINKSSQSKAGNTSLANTGSSEIMGLAVFKGDKLVGELNAIETMCHLLISNSIESSNVSIPVPNNSDEFIDLYLYNKKSPKIKVKIINGTPFISINMFLEAKVLSSSSTTNYMKDENIQYFSEICNQYMNSMFSNYLYKTSKEFYSDIDSLGKYACSSFFTSKEFDEYNWLENYKNSFFDININTNIQSAYLLSGQ